MYLSNPDKKYKDEGYKQKTLCGVPNADFLE